jgi:hypothetical protein
MNINRFFILRHLWKALAAYAVFDAPSFGATEPAWFEQHRGNDLKVHYVYLTGHWFDSKAEHDHLQEVYSSCVALHKRSGEPFSPLPPEGIPETPSPQNLEIYYGENRSLVIVKGKVHSIDLESCALRVHPHHYLQLPTGSAECSINLLTNFADGICDEHMLNRERNVTDNKPSPSFKPMGDINSIPPASRAQILEWAQRNAARPPRKSTVQPTGERRLIAGYQCDVYGKPDLIERCIANPTSDFPLPIAGENGYLPGLMLQLRAPGRILDAQEVILNMGVSRTLFDIPPGVTPRASSGNKGGKR